MNNEKSKLDLILEEYGDKIDELFYNTPGAQELYDNMYDKYFNVDGNKNKVNLMKQRILAQMESDKAFYESEEKKQKEMYLDMIKNNNISNLSNKDKGHLSSLADLEKIINKNEEENEIIITLDPKEELVETIKKELKKKEK